MHLESVENTDSLEVDSMKVYVKASRGNAQIGIWWYTDDKEVWAESCPTDDGELDGPYLQYSSSKNHMTLWSTVVMRNAKNNANSIIVKGYKSLERGRVIYNCRTACYEVTCSESLINDKEFRRSIIDHFDLKGNQIEFVKLNHYHKEELIGNLALDEFYYNSDM